jgi:hypothetical protein
LNSRSQTWGKKLFCKCRLLRGRVSLLRPT